MAAPVAPPTAPAKKPRERRHESEYRYVRRLDQKAGLIRGWQARAWLPPPLTSINLGIFESEWEAHRCVVAWVRSGADPLRLPDRGDGAGPVLPKWTKETDDCRYL